MWRSNHAIITGSERNNYEDQRGDARLKECTKFVRYLSQWSALTQEYEALEDSKIEIAENIASDC